MAKHREKPAVPLGEILLDLQYRAVNLDASMRFAATLGKGATAHEVIELVIEMDKLFPFPPDQLPSNKRWISRKAIHAWSGPSPSLLAVAFPGHAPCRALRRALLTWLWPRQCISG